MEAFELAVMALLVLMTGFVVGLLVSVIRGREIAEQEALVASANANAAAARAAEQSAFSKYAVSEGLLKLARERAASFEQSLYREQSDADFYRGSAQRWYEAWSSVANSKSKEVARLMAAWETLQSELDKSNRLVSFWRMAAMAKAEDLRGLRCAYGQLNNYANASRRNAQASFDEACALRVELQDYKDVLQHIWRVNNTLKHGTSVWHTSEKHIEDAKAWLRLAEGNLRFGDIARARMCADNADYFATDCSVGKFTYVPV